LEKEMSQRSITAQAAVAMATIRVRTNAAVSRLGPDDPGGGGGGGGAAGASSSGTSQGDGTLHSGGSADAFLSSPAEAGS
jgi:hypothetical protein